MRNKVIFLVLGAVISVLFWIFRVELYEAVYTVNGFSDQMFNTGAYGSVAAITIAMAWGLAAIYYYVINSVKFDRWYHWLAMLGITSVLTPVVCYIVVAHLLDAFDYSTAEFTFEIYNILFTALTFVIASFSIRWWSSNCRHTPIPQ
ncbi:MAG: hypothetical protein IKT03_08575 [Muribaculaceae bacterium]|nr:hypothetical protein [Muribaculaceae bacterium]